MAEFQEETTPSKAKEPPTGLLRWTPSIPTNVMIMLNPFSNDDADKATTTEANNASSQQSNKRTSILSSILPTISSSSTPVPPPTPPSPEKDDNSIMFSEPDTRTNSETGSREGSIFDELGRASKKGSKSKTTYSICHPPPASTARQRLHRTPRSVLQLHKLKSDSRPKPAFEVIPRANFSVRLTKATAKVFTAKHSLCPNDLVVLKAEKYSKDAASEEQEARDIIALICKGRREDGAAPGKARICLPEGREWEAYPTLNGGYEFFSTDEHGLGLTVRWVPKKNKDGSKPADSKKKFNFSTISPNSRRHPVIACLSRTALEINDTYKMPDPSAATPLSTPKQGSTILADRVAEEEGSGNQQCETDERLKQIITMTGIWVAFKEGWSPNFKYDDKEKDINGVQRSPSLKQPSPSKSATFAGTPVSTPPASPGTIAPLEKRSSMKSVSSGIGIFRRGSLLGKSANRGSTASVPEDEGENMAEAFDSTKKTGRGRADSSSTVLVHRAASNRMKNQQATWRPDLLSSQQEIQESPTSDNETSRTDSATTPTPQRRSSIANPILPPTNENAEAEATPRRPSDRVRKESSPEKRDSSATTATSTTTEASKKPINVSQTLPRRKKSGWRRLLCGSGQEA